MIHCNSNKFYVLRGSGNASETWTQTRAQWPLVINLENNNAEFGGDLKVHNGLIESGSTDGVNRNLLLSSSSGIMVLSGIQSSTTTSGHNTLMWGTATGNVVRFTSSIRFKEGISSLREVIETGFIIDSLRPVSFIAKATDEDEDPKVKAWREADVQYGFIAEEVATVNDGHLSVYEPSEDGEDIVPINWRMHDILAITVAELQSVRERLVLLEEFANSQSA
jgi:hypothetical protein